MSGDLERALRALDAAVAFAASYRFTMTEHYLARLAEVEALPQNQSGADKSHVWRAERAFVNSFGDVVPPSRRP